MYKHLKNNILFKEFEIFLWKKRRFRLRWDSSPGLSIAVRLLTYHKWKNFFKLLTCFSRNYVFKIARQQNKQFSSDYFYILTEASQVDSLEEYIWLFNWVNKFFYKLKPFCEKVIFLDKRVSFFNKSYKAYEK